MKKIFLAAMLTMTGIATSMAQKVTYFNLSEEGTEEPLLTIPFSDYPGVKYTYDKDENMSYVIVYSDKIDDTQIALSKNYDITYTTVDTPTAISEAVASKDMSINGNIVIISRLAEGAKVSVFDASGKLCAKLNANADGVATVNMTSLPKGVIVIKAGDISYKIRR